jgi:hypothetical protein
MTGSRATTVPRMSCQKWDMVWVQDSEVRVNLLYGLPLNPEL